MDEKEMKKPGRNALTIGIGSQATADRFLKVKNGTVAVTYEETVKLLLDAYETPTHNIADELTIVNLQKDVKRLENENAGYQSELEDSRKRISELEAQLEAARQEANTNAEAGLGKQLQLDELRQRTDGAIILKPNPVVAHFLNQMAEKTQSSPARILEELFLADLQNPLSNNLPYTVTSPEIRRVMAELKDHKED